MTAPLVAPTWRPTDREIIALRKIALPGGRYRRRTSYWTRAGAATIPHGIMDRLRHHGAVIYRLDAEAVARAEITTYGRAVVEWYDLAQAERFRSRAQAALMRRA